MTLQKTAKRLLSLLLVLMMVVSILPAGALAAETGAADNTVAINIMGTSDVHGQLYATDYTADASASGTYKQALTRAATYINEQRALYPNTFLADVGDLIQGTPLTYHYAFDKADAQDPAMKTLRMMGYDMFVLGNHEFNYGAAILNRQLTYLTSAATEGESQVNVSVANYLAAETNNADSKDWATWNGYAPYKIYDYDGVKVAVIGLGNPNVPKWDVPANWDGIYFAGAEETYKHYEAELQEKADVIVVATHCGLGSEAADKSFDSIRQVIADTDSIDLVISGHEHGSRVNDVENKDGEIVKVLQPGTKASLVSQAIITCDKDSKEILSIDAKNVNMGKYALNEELVQALQPYEEETWNNYMLQPIGKASGNFTAANLGGAPSAFVDLVNKVQIWGAYDRTGLNTPDDKSDDTPAQLSITAPLTAGSAANVIPEGNIVLGDMFKLYRYENWFYQITMSGKEVRTWLEYSASKVQAKADGTYNIAGGLTYYDVIYGDGFSYVIDAGAKSGSRITSMTYNGKEVQDNDTFTVVVNNYRYNGGGDYVKYLNEHGCSFTANDESRIIYSTQYDMIQGEDKGQARNLLADYIAEQGTIDPDIDSTWKIVNEGAYRFEVLSTTDMHGRTTTNEVSTQKEDENSMERVATIVNQERAAFGDDMLVIDNGDSIQGTLVAQYAINQKTSEENPMISAMKAIGYDVWNMGNHEFNFTPTQRDTQVQFAKAAGIDVLSANLVLKTDGKNADGESVKAGETYYKPYTVKTLDAGNGRTVRVAVIGIGNAANATWDVATNYPNLQFSSLDNPDGDLAKEINKWSKQIVDNNEADIIIVAAHSGTASVDKHSLESQAMYGASKANSIDLMISGHDHSATVQTVKNADGKEIYVVNGGGNAVTRNVFTVRFDADGNVSGFDVTADTLKLKDVSGDEALGSAMQPWYDVTYAWASAPLGTFDDGWTAVKDQAAGKNNNDMVLEQTELMNFVHKGQIWCSWQSYETDKIEGATVSIASPVFGTAAGGVLSFVPEDGDTISTLELAKLYRYSNNLLCAVDMTGEQLYNWMSTVADMYAINDKGEVTLAKGTSIYGVDTFYGVDYVFDASAPAGERVVSATIDGVDLLKYKGKIRVTLNSYRLSGGYGFFEATGLTEADCCWTASQYLGEDRAPVPTQLGEYVAHMKTVTPGDKVSHGSASTWSVLTETPFVNPFKDVKEGSYYYDAVLALAEAGVVNGMTETTFVPEGKVTRAQFATMLWRLAGEPEAKSAAPFTDVSATSYYAEAVHWAYEQEIVRGMSETRFAPGASITREQMATMLYRFMKAAGADVSAAADLSAYKDAASVSGYAVDAMRWAVEAGVINGMTRTTLVPQGTATRGQAATVLYRAVLQAAAAPALPLAA